MTARIPYEFVNAIVGVHRDACRIHMPMVRGAQNNVLLAFVDNEMRVFKFEPQEMVLKNSFIAYTCRNNGVKVPNISVQEHNGMFFEEYPIIQGQTLYERIANNAIDNVNFFIFDMFLFLIVYNNFLNLCTVFIYQLDDVNSISQ
jgi:hypothetical protein